MTRPNFRYFAVFAAMRTGSNLLERNMNQFAGIACRGELFNPAFIGREGVMAEFGISLEERERNPMDLVRALIDAHPGQVPGFRIFADHDPRLLDRAQTDPACGKIILRRNLLDSYISLLTARQTGQWMSKNERNRRDSRVFFDLDGFEAYEAEIEGFYRHLRHAIQASGQTAFHIDYDELKDVQVFNSLAAYLGVGQALNSLKEEIRKQNPGPLSERVENYDEMMALLTERALSSSGRSPAAEPERGPAVPNLIAARDVPLIYAPIEGPALAPVTAWMKRLAGGLRPPFNRNGLSDWLERSEGHLAFTVVSHPLERAYFAFMEKLFDPGEVGLTAMRSRLEEHYEMVLPPVEKVSGAGRAALEAMGHDLRAHRKAFELFLKFCHVNLAGQTSMRVDGAWASQDAWIDGVSQVLRISHIIRQDRLAQGLEMIADSLGVDAPGLPVPVSRPVIALEEIYNTRLEMLSRKAFARDYRVFGFGPWAEGAD